MFFFTIADNSTARNRQKQELFIQRLQKFCAISVPYQRTKSVSHQTTTAVACVEPALSVNKLEFTYLRA